ncbi:MAG: ATP-binding protein [Oscillospiraceae bacterium]
MHLALDFGGKALDAGYKVFFSSMNSLMHVLKTQEIFRASAARLKCIREFQILIVDKLGYPSVSKVEANLFFADFRPL